MSTISRNPFALLSGGDSDDEGGPTKQPVIVAPVQAKKPVPVQQPKRDRGDYPTRGAPRNVYGGPPPTAPIGEIEVIGSKPAGFTEAGRDDRGERRGGGGRGRGSVRGRGGRGGRGGGRFDDRPDKHSAMGTHDTDRKIAAGWGADEGIQELQAETDGWGDAKAAASPRVGEEGNDGWGGDAAVVPANGDTPAPDGNWGGGGPQPAGGAGSPPGGKSPESEEDRTKTFEEYLAEKAAATNPVVTFKNEARKPNEGVDDSQWKNAVQLIRGHEEEEVFLQINKEKKAVHAASAKKNKDKTYIEVEPLGYRPARAGGDRGVRGRGGGRGAGRGGGRGGDRDFSGNRDFGGEPREFGGGERREFAGDRRGGGGRSGRGGGRLGGSPKEFNAEDASAFPSLS